jgi:hypothetical protein
MANDDDYEDREVPGCGRSGIELLQTLVANSPEMNVKTLRSINVIDYLSAESDEDDVDSPVSPVR